MLLTSILNENLICCHLAGRTRTDLYRVMIQRARRVMMQRARKVVRVPGPIGALLRRFEEAERQGASAEGPGFCTPHLRLPELNDFYLMIGIADEPVPTESENGPIRVVLMGFVGGETGSTWLKALSAMVRHLTTRGMLDELAACGTPAEVIAHLNRHQVMLKRSVTADDLMSPPVSVEQNATISDALDVFARENRSTIAVVDEAGRLVGELDAQDLIAKFIPEYYFMMQSTGFLTDSDPFEQLARSEKTRLVRDFMIPPRQVIDAQMPLIRFTIELCRRTAYSIFVTDGQKMLIGELTVKNIIHRVLRG